MSRIATPASIEASPAASQPLLQAVKKQLGLVPNLFRVVGNSPAALEGYLGLNGALGKGKLDAKTRERIALAVAEINGCGYCLAAHSLSGARTSPSSTRPRSPPIAAAARTIPKADAAVRFAAKVVRERGHVADADLEAVRAAGYGDAEIIEIVLHVALNTLTNYVNEVAGTEIDFPVVAARSAA